MFKSIFQHIEEYSVQIETVYELSVLSSVIFVAMAAHFKYFMTNRQAVKNNDDLIKQLINIKNDKTSPHGVFRLIQKHIFVTNLKKLHDPSKEQLTPGLPGFRLT